MEVNNFFENIPDEIPEEILEKIIGKKNLKVERIISDGHSSPPNYWYDQNNNEFVLLLKGSAELSFENGENVFLKPGDYLIIPPHKKHRVENTDKSGKTIWLTIHF